MIGPPISVLPLSAASSSLIPYRSMMETVTCALNPAYEREMPLPVGLAVHAGGSLARRVLPAIFRAADYLRPLRQQGDATEVRTRHWAKFPDSIEQNSQTIFLTHPAVGPVLDLWDARRDGVLLDYLEAQRYRMPVFLMPLMRAVTEEVARRNPLMARHRLIAERMLENREELARKDEGMRISFVKDLRGIRDYDQDLFPGDFLFRVGVKTRSEDTILGRMAARLPQGAVVADWGSGGGLFGWEVKQMRPDLEVFSVDRDTPEFVLSHHYQPTVSAEALRGSQTFLTGDAFEMNLPKDRLADLLVQVHLLNWVGDPLGLLAHQYNQLKPGGVMVSMVLSQSHDVTRAWRDSNTVMPGFLEDLARLGIETESVAGSRTIAVRRKDARQMVVAADRVASVRQDVVSAFAAVPIHFSFYHPASAGPGRWVTLR
jgi:SAM-dependent methyltransferase